jgi:uncharacterized membrane protein YdbT with pleckstrin-like domain
MSYVDNNLMPGETVVCRATLHWKVYIAAAIFAVIAILGAFASLVTGAILMLVAAALFLSAYLRVASTELAVTNKRVFAKFGFLNRTTIEILHDKVESLRVEQSLWGRMLDFGSIAVHGSGGATTPIPNIAKPLQFRTAALASIEQSTSAKRS